ncbi:MAG: hypothetical protein MSIBF_04430 [Candidatus Altiarchaeales archaeon IMC4]|nr:MAG: hypothetical protein MSIBF_04430 [Candidatus Altiarchaeales archaeon IMC4]
MAVFVVCLKTSGCFEKPICSKLIGVAKHIQIFILKNLSFLGGRRRIAYNGIRLYEVCEA